LLASPTRGWRPIATAESWNGGQPVCNRFGFRFDGISVASAKGGSWRAFVSGSLFQDRGVAVRQLASHPGRHRTLADGASPYAFEALSQ
jgi:hypothetical protein